MSQETATETYHVEQFDTSAVSTAVVLALAETMDASPLEMEPLANYVDPDALDELFGENGTTELDRGSVTFTCGDYQIAVDAAGTITVTDTR
jgi:hypothetical protein